MRLGLDYLRKEEMQARHLGLQIMLYYCSRYVRKEKCEKRLSTTTDIALSFLRTTAIPMASKFLLAVALGEPFRLPSF